MLNFDDIKTMSFKAIDYYHRRSITIKKIEKMNNNKRLKTDRTEGTIRKV